MAEQLKNENRELEQTPDAIVDQVTNQVVSATETQEALSPETGKVKNAKDFIKRNYDKLYANPLGRRAVDTAQFGLDVSRVGGMTALKIVWGLLLFTKKAIEKKGNITFKEGFDLGSWALNPDAKKDKK
jgi:hypothetical protein